MKLSQRVSNLYTASLLTKKCNGAEFIYQVYQNNLYIYFVGTNHLYDWYYNLDCKINKQGYHSGFYQLAKKALKKVLKKLRKYKPRKVVLIGFSLGAAVANIIANLLSTNVDVELLTLGQPRIGISTVTNQIISHTNIVNKKDIVTQIPFWTPFESNKATLSFSTPYSGLKAHKLFTYAHFCKFHGSFPKLNSN